jgi:hypothetical protein
MLDDANSDEWSDAQINMFINYALIKYTHDLPIASACTYTVASDQVGDAHTYNLPDNFVTDSTLKVYLESASTDEFVTKLNIVPGHWTTSDEPKGYILDFPQEGQIYLPRSPEGTTFTLYYGAYHGSWLTNDADSFDLGRNRWGELAVIAYTGYLAFNPTSSTRALLEQWARRGDQNVGNPLEEEAARWLALYRSLLDEHAEVPDYWEFVAKGRS